MIYILSFNDLSFTCYKTSALFAGIKVHYFSSHESFSSHIQWRSSNHVTIIHASGALYKLRTFLSHPLIHSYCFGLCLGLISVLYLCYTQCKWRSSNKPSSRHCYTISIQVISSRSHVTQNKSWQIWWRRRVPFVEHCPSGFWVFLFGQNKSRGTQNIV